MIHSFHFRFSILQITIIITLCLWTQPLHSAMAMINKEDKDSCHRRCGNMDILKPFGIGAGCFYNGSFAVTCNNSLSSSSLVPILKELNLEVQSFRHIDEWRGRVTVKTPLVTTCRGSHNSSNNSINIGNSFTNAITEAWWTSPDMKGTPFNLLNDKLIYASVGCDGYAVLYNETGGFVTGCSSVCTPNPPPKFLSKNNCSGYGCCKIELGEDRKFTGYSIGVRVDNRSESCRSAYLMSKQFLKNDNAYSASFMAAIPVELEWQIDHDDQLPPGDKSIGSITSGVDWQGKVPFIIVGTTTLLVTCALLLWCGLCITQERRKEIKLRAKYFKEILEEQRSTDTEEIEKTKLFTIKELKRATDNFNEDQVLGEGGQGTVYKGMLIDGQVIAIKKSKVFDGSQWKQFINEVILLSQIKHRHVVKLLGCCLETKEPLLVYEFIPNGTLFEHLHKPTRELLLTWQMRLRIALEIANAISYLHSGSPTPIFHRDIKSSNILLDGNYKAKVSDFGISRVVSVDQTHLTTCVQGTFGYLDPEYFRFNQFSEKSDVYSFGIVLVELLTGQKPIRLSTMDGEGEVEASLAEYFIASMNNSSLYNILDPIVLEGADAKEDIMIVANLAKQCLNPRGIFRPTMKEVVVVLEALRNKIHH